MSLPHETLFARAYTISCRTVEQLHSYVMLVPRMAIQVESALTDTTTASAEANDNLKWTFIARLSIWSCDAQPTYRTILQMTRTNICEDQQMTAMRTDLDCVQSDLLGSYYQSIYPLIPSSRVKFLRLSCPFCIDDCARISTCSGSGRAFWVSSCPISLWGRILLELWICAVDVASKPALFGSIEFEKSWEERCGIELIDHGFCR